MAGLVRMSPSFTARSSTMGIDVQRGGGGDVTDDGGQRFHIHPMFQSVGGENMPEVMEANLFAPRMSQDFAQPVTGGGWSQRGVLFFRRGEHPS